MNTNNILIFSVDAEQVLLSSVILDNSLWEIINRNINKFDFYEKSHQIIFESIEFLMSEYRSVDIITIIEYLKSNGKINAVGGKEYLSLIIRNNQLTKNIFFYIKVVKDKSILRNLILINKNIIDYIINNQSKKVEEILDYAEQKIISVSKKYKDLGSFISTSDTLLRILGRIEKLYYVRKSIIGISSGFEELDKRTLGFHKSELIIIAGRPSMGKTAFAMNIVEHVVINLNKPVLVISMEMTAVQVLERMVSSIARIHLSSIRTGMLDQSDWPRLFSAVSTLSRRTFYIYDDGPMDLFSIKNIARKALFLNKNLSLIIIDYIQLIKANRIFENRTQELAEISRALKSLSKELDIPIIAISQLNRGVEVRQDKKPVMSDIRESGAIEQDADLILFIYREEVYEKKPDNKGKADIIISKQRNGVTGDFKLNFIAEIVRFESFDKKIGEYWNV